MEQSKPSINVIAIDDIIYLLNKKEKTASIIGNQTTVE